MERILDLVEKYPFDFLSHLSGIFPIIVGIIRRNYYSKVLRYIWFFFIFFFLKDSSSLWYIYHARSNIYIQNLEPIFEVGFVCTIYYICFSATLSKRIILYSGILLIGAIILVYSYERVSFVSLLTFRVYAIALSIAYFNKIIVDLRIKNILKHTIFWFSAGLLIYATGTFFISLFSEILFDPKLIDDKTFDTYWNLSNYLFILFSILSAIGLWYSKYDKENLL